MNNSQENIENSPRPQKIIIFDGVCNLCSFAVQFIIKHDKKRTFKFLSFQSNLTPKLLKEFNFVFREMDTFIFLEKGKIYERSDAAIRVLTLLGGFWKSFNLFKILPRFLRDYAYNFIAANRYQWFGKKEKCLIPDENIKSRFIL